MASSQRRNISAGFSTLTCFGSNTISPARQAASSGCPGISGGTPRAAAAADARSVDRQHPAGAEIKLRHYQLWEAFETGAFGDDHEERNQIAAIARQRGSRLLNDHLRGDQIVVVGDTPHDLRVAGPSRAGC